MLERKRQAKTYQPVPGEDLNEADLELGEGINAQRSGRGVSTVPTIEEEVDNWDENAEDEWVEDGNLRAENGGNGQTKVNGVAKEEAVESGKQPNI